MSRSDALPKLLRSIAGGEQARENKHDIILNAAADEIERLWAASDSAGCNEIERLMGEIESWRPVMNFGANYEYAYKLLALAKEMAATDYAPRARVKDWQERAKDLVEKMDK